jgi:hypothetical protein
MSKEKIKVEPDNMELVEKCITAAGNYIVMEATKFIKTLFTTDDEEASKKDLKTEEEVSDK